MKHIDIILLEDDPIDRIRIEIMISEFTSTEYTFKLVKMFVDYNSLVLYLQTNTVDIIISDIFTKDKATGIELLKKLQQDDTPVILITHSLDSEVYQEAKQYRILSYLIKPFHHLTLQATIEKVYADSNSSKLNDILNKKYLFLKGSLNNFDKINFDEILYLEADGNYCMIHTIQKKYIQKKSMSKILEEFDENFVRVHHKFAINVKHIEVVKTHSLLILNDIELPIGKSFKKALSAMSWFKKTAPSV